jgi:hypothetical protein
MVNEKDEERYEDEEDEYHFSDDQMNFDDTETPKTSSENGNALPPKESILAKLSQINPRRRAIVGGVIFVVLMALVYKMLSPSSSPTSDVLSEIKTTPTTPQVMNNPPPAVVATKPVQPPPPPKVVEQPMATVVATPPPGAAEIQKIDERLTALEQQTSAMMNLLQTEYAQKISDYEMQGNMVRGKMDELSKKMNRIESNLQQISQAAREEPAMAVTARHHAEPKIAYTVQAIIPGRAWLKSESGDTVTVAEGDVLRNYGRITKIDPYDGIVEIDTGNRVVALSYGMNVE